MFLENFWHNVDSLIEEYEKRKSSRDELDDFDDFAIEALDYEPLDKLLSERKITREKALFGRIAERDFYSGIAERLGIKSRINPWIWLEVIEQCESSPTADGIKLLLWLVAGGRFTDEIDDGFTAEENDDFLIRRWLGANEQAADLERYFNVLREKTIQFSKITDGINSVKTLDFGSTNTVEVERVFSVICENGFAENCVDNEILHNNLETVSQIIDACDFLKPIKPLVYFQIYVRQRNKLTNTADYVPNLKSLFNQRIYDIRKNNDKNFKQYAEYCVLYDLLKKQLSADYELCDAGFQHCSNLADWYHNLGYMNYKWCGSENITPEIPISPQNLLREMCPDFLDDPLPESAYPEIYENLDDLSFEELLEQKICKILEKYYCVDL